MSHVAVVTGTIIALEKVLNVVGYIPLVSNLSGCLRGNLGKVQAAASAALVIIALLFGQYALALTCSVFCLNGLANMLRGVVENIPVVGNVACLFYDIFIGRIRYLNERSIETLLLKL